MKINVDGSWNQTTKRASCGGLARDEQGEWLSGFTGTWQAEIAEAWALLKGIQLAKSLGGKQVYFESDSKKVVDAISQGAELGNLTDNILTACKRELMEIDLWHIAFYPKRT